MNKSPGPDNMHPRDVKELVAVIVHPFYFIVNLSLKTGKVPSGWKVELISAKEIRTAWRITDLSASQV